MFDVFFDAMMAWNQVGMILGGLVCFGIGGLLFGYAVYKRMACVRVKGRIVEVRATGLAIEKKEISPVAAPPEEKRTWANFFKEFRKSPGAGTGALLIAFLIISIPLLFIGFGSYKSYDYFALKTGGLQAEGTVVDNEYESSDDGGSYYAVVSFQDRDNVQWRVRDSFGKGGKPSFRRGEKVPVHYAADDPEHMIIGGFLHNMVLPLVFIAMGALVFFLLFILPKMQKKPRNPLRPEKTSYNGEMYYPVYEYMAGNGETFRNEDDSGSNWILGAIPGTEVKLLLDPKDPENIYRPGLIMPFFGLVFGLPGIALLYVAFTRFEFNIFSLVFTAGILAALAFKARKFIKPRSEWESKKSFRARMDAKRQKKRSAGRALNAQEIRDRVRVYDRYAKGYIIFLSVAAAGLIWLGAHLGQGMQVFLAGAESAAGKVVRIESVRSDDGDGGTSYTYYPFVGFTAGNGERLEFRDSVGSNPSIYKRGDAVDVLYDPAEPQHAIIDRGFWNWAAAGGCLIGGVSLLWLSGRLFAAIRKRRGRI